MKETFTKGMARNIYYGGSLFFLLLFFGLTFDTVSQLPERDNRQAINESVTLGKKVWEVNNCIGCHTLLGGRLFCTGTWQRGGALRQQGCCEGVYHEPSERWRSWPSQYAPVQSH